VVEAHFGALKGLIVHERNAIDTDVYRFGNRFYGRGFCVPVDLGIEKVVFDAELAEFFHGRGIIIPARDRLQDASPVQALYDTRNALSQCNLLLFEKYTMPERVIEVPYDALDFSG